MTGIERAVLAAGGSHADLASVLGVTRQAVQQWVTQGYAPRDKIVEIAKRYKIARADLADPDWVAILGKSKS